MPTRFCLVLIPSAPPSKGSHYYPVSADSSFEAVWNALQAHEARLQIRVPDDSMVRVILDGKDGSEWDMERHNAKQPNFLHIVGPVRAWAARRAKAAKA
ncbi:MAG: hypothetical protein ABIR70_19855 [Bryobacteraceae bacterium]